MSRIDDPLGVLLINVGSPDAPRTREVRRYLRQFLSDPSVIDINAVARWLLLHLVILPLRPRASAEAYRSIWLPGGSPLLLHTQALSRRLQASLGDKFLVATGMRYGNPSMPDALARLERAGVRRVLLFPLYPQYAASTTGSALAAARRWAAGLPAPVSLCQVPPFYDNPGFVEAFRQVGLAVLRDMQPDRVLFSFHGLPERQILRSDRSGSHCLVTPDCCASLQEINRSCYRALCFETARRIAAAVGLEAGKWSVSFQSRLGRTPWIRPYTDEVLAGLPSEGVRRLAVFCPAFVADCLETLEEIGIRGRERFRQCGGEELRLVPSLNDHPAWVEAAVALIRKSARRNTALLPDVRVSDPSDSTVFP